MTQALRFAPPELPVAARCSVLIVDDMPLVAETVSKALEALFDFEVAVAASHAEALAQIAAHGPYDAVLLDLNMPCAGEFVDLQVLDAANGGRIAVYSGTTDRAVEAAAVQAGAAAFLPKGMPIPALAAAIRKIADAAATTCAGAAVREASSPCEPPRLKPRELRLLSLLAGGLDLDAAAAALGVDGAVVRFDIRSLRRKLGAATIEEATRKAHALHLI